MLTSFDGLTSDNPIHEARDAASTPVVGSDGAVLGEAGHAGDDDAASPPPDDAGAVDSTVADTSAPVDAPVGTSFCNGLSPAPLFCDDFDESTSLPKWDSLGSKNGANVVDALLSKSPAQSVASSSVTVSNGAVDVGLYKMFSQLTGSVRLETLSFDMYLDTIDSAHSALAVVGALALRNTTNGLHELQFVLTMSNGKVLATFPEYTEPGDGGATGFIAHNLNIEIPMKTWTHIAMELDLASPNGGAGNLERIYIDGNQVASIVLSLTVKDPAPQVVLGLSYVSPPSDPWTVRYDNVTFSSTP